MLYKLIWPLDFQMKKKTIVCRRFDERTEFELNKTMLDKHKSKIF